MKKKSYIFFIVLLFSVAVKSQRAAVPLQDLTDVLRGMKNPSKPPNQLKMEVKKIYPALLPIIGYGPANGFVIGGGASLSGLLGDSINTHISSGLFNVTFTTKKQINLNFRSNIYSPGDKWILQGDWRFLFFSQPTYGLGISDGGSKSFDFNVDGIGTLDIPGEQPMRFNYLRFYENVYKRVAKNLYAGLGLNIDYHSNIQDQSLDTTTPNPTLTYHFLYSVKHGFDPLKYMANGFSMNFIYDRRDNAINAFKGMFAQLSFRSNFTWMGSAKSSTTLFYDYRKYFRLTPDIRGNVLAFWTWGQFLTSGNLPYLALPSITWDMYNRSGRGYVQGRFRGESMVYAETEYRFPISRSGIFGGVLFLNATTANSTDRDQHLFDAVAPGYGAGLRLKMSKQTRTNIGMDIGFGRFGSGGIYFNLQEAF